MNNKKIFLLLTLCTISLNFGVRSNQLGQVSRGHGAYRTGTSRATLRVQEAANCPVKVHHRLNTTAALVLLPLIVASAATSAEAFGPMGNLGHVDFNYKMHLPPEHTGKYDV